MSLAEIIGSIILSLVTGWLTRHKVGPFPLSRPSQPTPSPSLNQGGGLLEGLGQGQLIERLRQLLAGGGSGGSSPAILPALSSPLLSLALQLIAGILTHPSKAPAEKIAAVNAFLEGQRGMLLEGTAADVK